MRIKIDLEELKNRNIRLGEHIASKLPPSRQMVFADVLGLDRIISDGEN